MSIELDHFLIVTEPGAPQAQRLTEIGLVEGAGNTHPGQGTANRRFFFANGMLELVYIRDLNEAVNGPGNRLRLAERAVNTDASPFGLIFRATAASSDAPFPGWHYYPDYLPPDKFFVVGENSGTLQEPLCVCMPDCKSPAGIQPQQPPRFSKVTDVRISLPLTQISSVLQAVARVDRVSLRFDRPHLMEVQFNDNAHGQTHDLRPYLPLVVYC